MSSEVAIVGMACRFPDAPNLTALWRNIVGCRVSFQKLERQRWVHSRFYSPTARDAERTYAETAAFVDEIELFASRYFGIAPRRAEAMDPQQRIILELVYQALQDAGLERRPFDRSKTATYIGASVSEYKEFNLSRPRTAMLASGDFGSASGAPPIFKDLLNRVLPMRGYTFPGSMINMSASLVSQTFDFGGPAYVVDAACASSLTAVFQAIEYLRAQPPVEGPAPVAVVGGVYLNLLPDNAVGFARIGAIARRECRPFDEKAEGFVMGEGAGVVVLKRLDQAIADGDRIYATLRGGASNSDGRNDSPLAPRYEGQVALLKAGLTDSGVDPATIDYVECHGTGTPSADATELRALTHVLGYNRSEKRRIGSIKANIGHSMSASGMAALLRATLAVYHATYPPQAGFSQWHPGLETLKETFQIDTQPHPWQNPLRRALVSSFGFGGINGLVMLENGPAQVAPALASAGPQLFCFSAPTPELLEEYLKAWLLAAQGQPLASLAYTQTMTRQRHRFGVVAVARNLNELQSLGTPLTLTQALPLHTPDATSEDRQWLLSRGVNLAESEIEIRGGADFRLRAMGAAWLLGQDVDLDDFFQDRRLADLPPVPLIRQRHWIIEALQVDPLSERLFEQVARVVGCTSESLRPELYLESDLAMTSEQIQKLKKNLATEFGFSIHLAAEDINLAAVATALAERPAAPTLPLDVSLTYDTHPFLLEHCPKGRTLLPFSFAIELLARAQGAPLPLVMENVAVRRGLQIQEACQVRLDRSENEIRLLELRGARELVAFSARPQTDGSHLTVAPAVPSHKEDRRSDSFDLTVFYRDVAYQGPMLQGITEIFQRGRTQVCATVKTSRPHDWIPADERSEWAIDPLIVDAALQIALYWAQAERGQGAVPLEIERLVWLSRPSAGQVIIEWELTSQSDSELSCNASFHQKDVCLGWLQGLRFRLESPRQIAADPQSVESLPGYVELQRRMKAAHERGFVIPYFQSHDELRGPYSQIEGRELINFSSYNYVGLSGHPDVTAASNAASDRYGTSVSASRLVAGERPLHRQLERKLADFLGCEDSVAFVSGYLTNVTVISHLMEAGDLILYDSLSHDCILKGVRASAATRQAFPHNDLDALEDRLVRIRKSFRRVLVVVEGVYSMDGDYPDLARLVELRERYKFWLMIDEAHSLGTLGRTGRGIGEHYGVARDQVDLWSGTLSKALASCGGYVAGRRQLIEYLKFTTPGFVYSVGMTPASAAAALAALEVLAREPERVRDLQKKSAFFLSKIKECGLDPGLSQATPVVPVILGDSAVAWELARRLTLQGINTCPIVYPAVEEKSARLRFFITSLHTMEQLEYAAVTTAACLADLALVAGARI